MGGRTASNRNRTVKTSSHSIKVRSSIGAGVRGNAGHTRLLRKGFTIRSRSLLHALTANYFSLSIATVASRADTMNGDRLTLAIDRRGRTGGR
eukprot:9333138-Prorocentrum_lima.AAC.1